MTNLYPGGQQATPGLTAMGAPPPAVTVATTTGGEQPAAAPPSPTAAPGPRTGRNTPRLLARLRAAVIVTSLLFAVLCLIGTAMPYGTLNAARLDIEQGQRLRNAQASLAHAQALAAEAADPKVNGDVAQFRAEADSLAAALVTAASAVPSDAAALGVVSGQVGTFRAAVEVGLAQRTGSDATKAQAAVTAANAAASDTAGKGLSDLTTAADNRLPSRFSVTFLPLVVAAAVVALATAVLAATMLGMRTRRILNVGITGSVLVLLVALGLALSAAAAVTRAADVTHGDTLAGAHAAVEAQTLMEQARTAQLTGTAAGQTWAQLAGQVSQQLQTVGSSDASLAWSQAEAAQAKADLPGTRAAIGKAAAALTPVAAAKGSEAARSVAFDQLLTYGISAALLAVLGALLGAWGLTQRLNEYR